MKSSLFLLSAFCSLLCLRPAHASALQYQIVVTGGHTAMQGSSVTVIVQNLLLAGTPVTDDTVQLHFTDQGAGQPLPYGGIDFTCPDQYPGSNVLCSGSHPHYGVYGIGPLSSAPVWLSFVISPTAALGDHAILIQGTSTDGVVETTTITLHVMSAAQLTPSRQPYLPAAPIPQKAHWESDMLVWGAHWCVPANTGVLDESILYYDGTRVYYQMADYTNNPGTWNSCARWTSDDYVSNYVIPVHGGRQGFEIFTKGSRLDHQRTGNTNSALAVNLLDAGNWYGVPEHATQTDAIRESSYALEARIDDLATNGVTYPYIQDEMQSLLGQLDQIFIQRQFDWYQPFMVGLAMEALIQYYNEVSPDPRIPYVIKQSLDGLWADSWTPQGGGFAYRCYGNNPPGSPGSVLFGGTSLPGCYTPILPGHGTDENFGDGQAYPVNSADTLDYNNVQPNLNNLISPAYAWMYLQTGEIKYRERADTLFANGTLNDGFLSYAGKGFSQNYRWSFDYVSWRNQANAQAGPLPPSPAPPTIVISTPSAGAVLNGIIQAIASASGSVNITNVQFLIDGSSAGISAAQLPFETNIQTSLFSNGSHNLTAVATDEAGNQTTSAPVAITINNTPNLSFAQCPTTSIPTGAFQGCYYSYPVNGNASAAGNDMYSNANLGTLTTTRTDPAPLNASWGPGVSPAPGVSTNFYGVIWQGNFNFPATGNYEFSVSKNGGFRLYIDNEMVNNNIAQDTWWPPDPVTPVFEQVLTGGIHQIRVEYWISYTDGGSLGGKPAGAQVSWVSKTNPLIPPIVEWTNPWQGIGYPTHANIPLTVSAFGMGGATIREVDFYNGTTLLGSVPNPTGDAQYSWTWPNVPNGNYVITAKATDSNGSVTSVGSQGISVAPPPTINWLDPAGGSVFREGSNITFTVAATPAAGDSITQVLFNNNATGTLGSPGQYSWTWAGVPAGIYSIASEATDSDGVTAVSPTIQITVKSSSPTVSIVAPVTLAGFTPGSMMTLSASASGTFGATITQVQFYSSLAPGGWLPPITVPTGGLYSMTIPVVAGNYILAAQATDSNGLITQTPEIFVAVHNSPTTSWQSPLSGQTYTQGSPITLTASATADSHTGGEAFIRQIDFFNGSTLLGSGFILEGNNQFSFLWPNPPVGNYSISARATDDNGLQSAFSPPITLTVNGGAQTSAFTNILNVKIYPNPWRFDKHAAFGMTFDGLVGGTTVKIFTVSGHEVKELNTDGSKIVWDLTNDSGDKVGSGVYLYLITDGQGDKVRGKIGIIK